MIKSAVEIIYNESYQCNKCIKKVHESVRENTKNCTGKAKAVRKKPMDEFTFELCPGNFYNPAYGQLLDMHRLYRKGVLAGSGGLLDQPSKYVDLMNLMESLIVQKELEAMKKSAKDGRKQSKR